MEIRMNQKEADLFRSFLCSADSYFEYGMGGSTQLAADLVKGRVVAIDSDGSWVEKLRRCMHSSAYERSLHFIDIGPTGDWGHPVNMDNETRFAAYYEAIKNFSPSDFDMCLIDGRFRVASFLTAVKYMRRDAIIAFHDYRSRKHFHIVENFGKPIAEADDLTIFAIRSNYNMLDLEKLISMFRKNSQ